MTTLYRKYRPQTFKEVVGQNHIKVTLQNEIKTGKIAHAYLFCGPRAVGKTTLARVLAKSINCLNRKDGDFEPCNTCTACTEITAGSSLDMIEIDAASNTGVDNVRDNIIASARVTPAKNKFKVFIIDEVHMLSISAFNALLKIMEEPPKNVVFILCTTEVHKVPSTIISRCQRFDFKRISMGDVTKKLSFIVKEDGINIDKNILESIARQSDGYMRDAESLLGQLISIGGKEITQEEADLVIPRSDINEILNLIEILIKKDPAGGIKLVNNLIDEGVELKNFLNNLVEILRKILISKISPALSGKLSLELGESMEIKINDLSRNLEISNIVVYINKFNEAKNKLKDNFIAQLPLELAIIELCLGRNVASNPPVSTARFTPMANRATNNLSNSKPIQPVANNNISVNISENEIREKWSEVLVKIKKYNHSLSFILRACEPRGLNGNQLCLAFKYKFHKERVTNQQIKAMVENVLREVYGNSLVISAIVDESLSMANITDENNGNGGDAIPSNPEAVPSEEKPKDSSIDNLLKTFGGKIVK
ncbi:MAG: DNA polymerase III subunit gamma/tau [Patescibacteria group bacterium]|nr:DNA polymerase III subunit gamma/tau [Patescibacteria group bacterium]